jgi:predicted porin
MKKSLLALAVAAALPAFAYAQTNIILNGSIDGSLESINGDANLQTSGTPAVRTPGPSDIRVSDGIWSGSRFAISGTEELGGGLKGIFNIEHRLASDTGTQSQPVFWHGQSWVGLQGGFGAIRFGRQYTPMFRALAGGDVTGYSWYNNLSGGQLAPPVGPNGGTVGGWTVRFNNDVSWQSPSLGGFTIHAAYSAGENGSPGGVLPGQVVQPAGVYDNKLGDTWGVAALGAFGPINVGVGYHNTDYGDLDFDNSTEIGVSLGAKFGNFGIGLAGIQTDDERLYGDEKRKAMFGSLSAGVGPGTVYLTLLKDDQGGDFDNTGLALTYSHGLSKRTFVYASVGYNKVEQPVGDDLKPRKIALGVRHFF